MQSTQSESIDRPRCWAQIVEGLAVFNITWIFGIMSFYGIIMGISIILDACRCSGNLLYNNLLGAAYFLLPSLVGICGMIALWMLVILTPYGIRYVGHSAFVKSALIAGILTTVVYWYPWFIGNSFMTGTGISMLVLGFVNIVRIYNIKIAIWHRDDSK